MGIYRSYKVSTLLVLFLILLGLSISVDANPDTAIIHVNINTINQLTLLPEELTWTAVDVGDRGGFHYMDIKNTGSINITNIYGYVDTLSGEPSRPYASDQATDYSAGGVVLIRNESGSRMFFAGRIEWNWTSNVSNTNLSNMTDGLTTPMAQGFLRNSSNQYYWALINGTGGECNATGTLLAIEDEPDNGTVQTRFPGVENVTFDGAAAGGWGIFSITRDDSIFDGYCIAVNYTCEKLYVYKHDYRSNPGFDQCSNVNYIREPGLIPGQEESLTLDVHIPLGIPDGAANPSVFTVTGTGVS
ncbi:hypothetical protein ACFLQN_01395 [Candidatus Aenigmatarchaeota archaeon]